MNWRSNGYVWVYLHPDRRKQTDLLEGKFMKSAEVLWVSYSFSCGGAHLWSQTYGSLSLCEVWLWGEIIPRDLLRSVLSYVEAQVGHESVLKGPFSDFQRQLQTTFLSSGTRQKWTAVCLMAVTVFPSWLFQLMQMTSKATIWAMLRTVLLLSEELFSAKYDCSGTFPLIVGILLGIFFDNFKHQ